MRALPQKPWLMLPNRKLLSRAVASPPQTQIPINPDTPSTPPTVSTLPTPLLPLLVPPAASHTSAGSLSVSVLAAAPHLTRRVPTGTTVHERTPRSAIILAETLRVPMMDQV
ncbi:hypothetical protein FIBSPDRAFT_955664 [Athelia psychrophila]|uniref:Uncharacterized protein n=1 Tax=Athelia psychrophila TaxID=1759441 RepID=A0A166HQD7_9AGAM|nr:hypothetical protein FIBSPDRAFT_955664 [Fibularhizoctonia sp. CBS 109695]